MCRGFRALHHNRFRSARIGSRRRQKRAKSTALHLKQRAGPILGLELVKCSLSHHSLH